MPAAIRLVTYNLGQGGARDPAVWARAMPRLAPDLFFAQESHDPRGAWLAALPGAGADSWLWAPVAAGRWGSGLWARAARLTPLAPPEDFAGWVVAAVVEGAAWPGLGVAPVVALSIHAPGRRGRSYLAAVGQILDFARAVAGGLPLIVAGDFNVAVGLRDSGLPLSNSPGERALLARLRDELDLLPCWQTAHPGEPLARTLRWLRHSDSAPYHCDGLFIPAAWRAALTGCEALEDGEWPALSDHNPVVATLACCAP